MNQPTKDAMREQLALAADEIIRLRIIYAIAYQSEQQSWRGRVRAWWRRVAG